MFQIAEYVDDRQKAWCIHCRKWIADVTTNRDHTPSKCLLRKPYPPNLPTVAVCESCNAGFSSDEEYLATTLAPGLRFVADTKKVDRVLLKNARGHAYFELGEPMLEQPTGVLFAPLETLSEAERTNFEKIEMGDILPEVGSRMLTRVFEGQDMSDRWVIVQNGIYRYGVSWCSGIVVRSVLREFLATEVRWNDSDLAWPCG